MLSNRLAFAALAAACIGAAAGGGYLATRQNVVPAPTSAEQMPATHTAQTPVAGTTSAGTIAEPGTSGAQPVPVQETEAVIGDPAPKTPVAPPAAKSAPAKRADPPQHDRRAAAAPVGEGARHDQPPPLANSWPSSASQPPAPTTPAEQPAPRADERTQPESSPEPPQKQFEELVVAAESVIGLQTESRITSETARVEDRVEARVTRDVKVGERVAIPAGTRAIGSVMQVDRGGKFKERARLVIRF